MSASTRERLREVGLDEALLELVLNEHRSGRVSSLRRLWTYYRNAACGSPAPASGDERTSGRLRLAQEAGLPKRLTGGRDASRDDRVKPEVVIENDIAWRVHAMVDFMFGKPVRVLSNSENGTVAAASSALLDEVWERSGGIALLQDMALLGHVYGHVDLLVRADGEALASLGGEFVDRVPDEGEARRLAKLFRIEVVEPTRGVPILSDADWRVLDGYAVDYERGLNQVRSGGRWWKPGGELVRARERYTEVFTPTHRVVMRGGEPRAVERLGWTGGEVPVAHIQNLSQPFRYEGLGEVEPLIPLQDELNTRLSDRASRVTMQSFRMYLAKGLEGFENAAVGPGRVWSTDNPEASIESFGGDGASPSEDAHVEQIREAMDKQSGVPPLASGVVRARIGNLSSANALRVTLMGVLSKTARKRVAYGRGMSRASGLVLSALSNTGVWPLDEPDRGVRLEWPDPLPEDPVEMARAARARTELGVSRERVLSELGYGPGDPGVG
ncbi:MAG: phage portal protein [Planctomycetota bacterium]